MKAILIASIYIILGNHIARSYRQRFALHLLPHNFAVGVSNGQDFVIKTTQLAIDKFITGPQSDGRLPTRAVVFTDMTNMFNLISREELRDCLRSHFPELIQVADFSTKSQATSTSGIEYQPNHTLGDSNLPPSQFAVCGADITIDHCPDPPPNSAIEDIPSFTANAERCLQKAEKRKFTTMGSCTVTTNTMSREDVLRTLHSDAKHLQMWAIYPYGGLGPMFRRFLFGDDPIQPLSFSANKPHAAKMYVAPSKAQLLMASVPLQILLGLLMLKEATTLLELALWKVNLDDKEGGEREGVRTTRGRRKRARKEICVT
eukprot:CAMPEP_0201688944 /NCGR_PEP_ID=MMETSP0578-20130828/2607_1 /ASSEMBLY_ACC=CAM_ASM_000663 /TAXON_ID=267565 /ORGANISM="Skeletonema grethea, Strain CCMP 1804" /LENGTH=316 /DNA_ID=CAMNT_0048173429 /DNA_START=675 /DNA_END=1623 /DNA_ORIENTATION=-